jgi:hypothetical protein
MYSALCLGVLVVRFASVNRAKSKKLFAEALKYIPGGIATGVIKF